MRLKPKDAIKIKSVDQNPAAPAHRPVGKMERKKLLETLKLDTCTLPEKRRMVLDGARQILFGQLKRTIFKIL